MRRMYARWAAIVCSMILLWGQCAAPPVQAATNIWNGGGGDDLWSTGANWDTNPTPPANDGTADVHFAGTTRLTPDVDAPWSIHSLLFDSGAGAFTIGDMQLTIGAGGITNNSTNTETINTNISVAAAQSWTAASGDLSFGGAIITGNPLTITGAFNTAFANTSNFSGTGSLIKDGSGTFTMSGTTVGFTGGVIVQDGILKAGPTGGLPGNVSYTINGGTLDLNGIDLTISRLSGTGGNVFLNSADLTVNQTTASTYSGVISGDGGLTKLGIGLLEITGTNTYTGGTTVSAGTLQGNVTSLQGDITDNATVIFNQTGLTSGTYASVISGTGVVTKIGNGTVIFTGANTYSGGTTVSAGVLQGTTDSLQGNIDVTGTGRVEFSQTTNGTYSGIIDGSGAVIKSDTGTVSFTGANTYVGATTISGGTLQIGNGGVIGSLAAATAITDNATLAFNRSDAITVANTITGTGALHQIGPNTLTLTGNVTNIGGTTIDAGSTIQVGNGGTTGTLGSGPTADNGTLLFNRSDTLTVNSNISGAGNVRQIGTGTTILGGTNSYTGGTTVVSGTLQGTTASLQGSITNNANVTFSQATNGTYAGVMRGPGTLIKEGTGTVQLSGANTYTGATTVNDGVLNVNGSITSNVGVDAAGTFGGTGTVTGNVDNDGTVTPGSIASPIGTLRVVGAFTNESGAAVQVNIDSNNNGSVLDVTGTATINGGTVIANSTTGSANAGQKFVFLTAGSRVGTFDNAVSQNLPVFLIPVLGYTSDTAFFTLLRNGETYQAVGNTFNERAVGGYLDQISPTASGDLQTVFDGLNSIDDPELRVAESQMAGAIHGTLAQIGVQNTTLIIAQVAQRLRSSAFAPEVDSCCCGCGRCAPGVCSGCLEDGLFAPVPCCGGSEWTPWAQGFGAGASAKSDGNAEGVAYSMGGVVAGMERWIDDCRLLGFHGGYVGTTARTNAPNDTINGGNLGAYLYADDSFNYYTLMSGFEFDGYNTHRLLAFDGIDRQASANYFGWQAYAYAERGVSYESCGRLFQPFVALQYLYLGQNNFTERGAGSIDLAASGVSTNSLRSLLGARLQWAWMHSTCRRSFPEIHAYWLHEYLDSHSLIDATFSPTPENGSTPFIAHGLDMGRDWAIVGASFTWEMHCGWSMFVNGDVQTNNQATIYLGSGGVGHIW